MQRAALAITLLLLQVPGCGAIPKIDPVSAPAWSERGVFVFGDLVFDFQKQLEVYGPVVTTLVNCSDETYFCAYASYLHIVLPRKCPEFKVGQSWSHAGIKTVVLSVHQEGQETIHTFVRNIVLLGSSGFPGVVYEYTRDIGVTGIYVDSSFDLVAAALSGGLLPDRIQGAFQNLVTLDHFGQCTR